MADVNATNIPSGPIWAIFKEVYGDKIAMQANVLPFMYNQFEKSKTPFGGKYFTEPLQDEGGQAVGSYNDSEQVADAQAETTKEIQIRPRFHYATIRISGPALAAARKNLFAFVQTKDFEIKSKTNWLISQLNAQTYMQGRGILGAVVAPITNGAAGSFTLDVTQSAAFATSPNWFRKGMKIDVWTSSSFTARRDTGSGVTNNSTKNSGGQIASFNRSTNLITMVGTTAAVAAGDVITYEDAQLSGAAAPTDASGKQITGLATLVDDVTEGPQTVQNVDRNVFTIFRGNRLANGGVRRALSLDLMQQAFDQAEVLSGTPPDLVVGGFGQRRQYLNLLWYDARYQPEEFRGGFRVLKYNGVDFYVDKDCQIARIYFLNRELLNKFEVQGIGILDQAGPQMERVPKFDVYEILLGGYLNMGAIRPNGNTKLVDLVEP